MFNNSFWILFRGQVSILKTRLKITQLGRFKICRGEGLFNSLLTLRLVPYFSQVSLSSFFVSHNFSDKIGKKQKKKSGL